MGKLDVFTSRHLESTVWRAVPDRARVSEDDFRSYADLGRNIPTAEYLRLTSVSMFLTLQGLRDAQKKYPSLPQEAIELELRQDERITYAVTNKRTGHIEVWAPAAVLLSCVVP